MNRSGRSAWCTKAELSDQADSKTTKEAPHGKYVLHRLRCSQEVDQLLRERRQRSNSRARQNPSTRYDLDLWMKTLPGPWMEVMEATMFTGWTHDHLRPHAVAVKVAHPLMLRAIAAAKKKNDRIDAEKLCDRLRCDFLPECYMASTPIRERRRTLTGKSSVAGKRKRQKKKNRFDTHRPSHGRH